MFECYLFLRWSLDRWLDDWTSGSMLASLIDSAYPPLCQYLILNINSNVQKCQDAWLWRQAIWLLRAKYPPKFVGVQLAFLGDDWLLPNNACMQGLTLWSILFESCTWRPRHDCGGLVNRCTRIFCTSNATIWLLSKEIRLESPEVCFLSDLRRVRILSPLYVRVYGYSYKILNFVILTSLGCRNNSQHDCPAQM